jgi:hypothetical protein
MKFLSNAGHAIKRPQFFLTLFSGTKVLHANVSDCGEKLTIRPDQSTVTNFIEIELSKSDGPPQVH